MINIAQDMNTVIETSQSSPASQALGAIILVLVTIGIFSLFKKDKW